MKKIICLLLCLMMLVPAAVSLARSVIPSVSVTLTIPKAGSTAKEPAKVTVPSNVVYEVSDTIWLKEVDNSLTMMLDSDIFEAGKDYYIDVELHEPTNNYDFPSDRSKYSANVTISDFYADYNHGGLLLCFKVPAGDTEKVTLSKLKSVKLKALSAKKMEVSWKKLSKKDQKKIQKIQIQYSTDKTFKTYKTKWAKKGASSVKISGLKKNTKYYIRIRAYKKSGGVIYVSKWVTKNKKTKKK